MSEVPIGWRAWARNRERELLAGGVEKSTASFVARVEARKRAEISKTYGPGAAKRARLTWLEDEESGGRFVLVIPPERSLPKNVTFYALFGGPKG